MRDFGRRALLAGAGFGLLSSVLAGSRSALAASAYPDHAVRLISPWAPGGSADVLTRIMAERFSSLLGQQFVVENRAGATGTIGHAAVAKARPDGFTLLLGSNSTYAIIPHLMTGLPYQQSELAPIGLMAANPQILCIHPSIPAKDLAGFVAYAKANPGAVTYGSGGVGGTSHLASAMLSTMAGIQMVHVPYRGAGPAQQALVAGEVKALFLDVTTAAPLSESGMLRALAVSTAYRSPVMPSIPTVAESGYPGFESASIFALFAPAGTPELIIETLNRTMLTILAEPATKARLQQLGLDPIGGSPAELAKHIETESAKWGRLIAANGIRLD